MTNERAEVLKKIESWTPANQKIFMAMMKDLYSTVDLQAIDTPILQKEVEDFEQVQSTRFIAE